MYSSPAETASPMISGLMGWDGTFTAVNFKYNSADWVLQYLFDSKNLSRVFRVKFMHKVVAGSGDFYLLESLKTQL